MTTGNDDQAFIAKAKSILDRSADALDARQRARLRAARRRALAQAAAPRFIARPLLALGAAAGLAPITSSSINTWSFTAGWRPRSGPAERPWLRLFFRSWCY